MLPSARGIAGLTLASLTLSAQIIEYSPPPPVKAEGADQGLFRFQRGGKWGFTNRSGRTTIAPRFSDAHDFFEGLAAVEQTGKWGYIAASGEFVIVPRFDGAGKFDRGKAPIKVNERWGLIDRTGTFIVSPQFDAIGPFSPEGLATVWVNAKRRGNDRLVWIYGGKWGFMDRSGKLVINPQFDWAQDFSEGLAAVGFGGERFQGDIAIMNGVKWGFIDPAGKLVIPAVFDEVRRFSSGTSVVWSAQEHKLGLIDRNGNLILPYQFRSIEPFHEGLAPVRGPDGEGYITPDGSFGIRASGWDFGTVYQGFGAFSDGLAPINKGDNRTGFIDRTGRIQIPIHFTWTTGFSEGLAAVKVGAVWGYINMAGKMVIQPKFSAASSFVDGLALVRTGTTLWSYIDKRGSVVLRDVFRSE